MGDRFYALDGEIREWMAKQGWGVTTTLSDFDSDVLGWRHEKQGERSITLRVGRQALEDWEKGSPLTAASSLDVLDVAKKLGKTGDVFVKRTADGTLSAEPQMERFWRVVFSSPEAATRASGILTGAALLAAMAANPHAVIYGTSPPSSDYPSWFVNFRGLELIKAIVIHPRPVVTPVDALPEEVLLLLGESEDSPS